MQSAIGQGLDLHRHAAHRGRCGGAVRLPDVAGLDCILVGREPRPDDLRDYLETRRRTCAPVRTTRVRRTAAVGLARPVVIQHRATRQADRRDGLREPSPQRPDASPCADRARTPATGAARSGRTSSPGRQLPRPVGLPARGVRSRQVDRARGSSHEREAMQSRPADPRRRRSPRRAPGPPHS